MPLRSGARLGPYEILSPLGVGGMGEVYRAADTNLKRQVAIKVLPKAVAADPERVARFQREAEVLAALNHPHIAAIYGLERTEGTTALVLELVEGPTLADRIAAGAIPLREALPIAKQIAEALEAARERGLIHRDLKPANIKVREDGTVKVLDFGLAKAVDPSASRADATNSPTMMTSMPGVILGTAAYMSPEQARGKTVDKRTDMWAFGCVLFEMLTGAPAFPGDTTADIISAIVRTEPDWRGLPDGMPASIRVLLRRCLAKVPEQRLRDMGDARIELGEAMAEPPTIGIIRPAGARVPPRQREVVAWGLVAAGVALAAVLALRPSSVSTAHEVVRLSVLPQDGTFFVGQSFFTVGVPQFELSPDGRAIVFVAAGQGTRQLLWLRPLDSVTARPLAGTEGADSPFWSPDDRQVAFFASGKLKKVSIADGSVQEITTVLDPRPGSWGRDDTIIFSRGVTGVMRVAVSGGRVTPVTELDTSRQEGQHRYPQFLPDGNRFLFGVRSTVPANSGIYVGSLDGKTRKQILPGTTLGGGGSLTARYSSGYLFFMDGDTLMRQAFDRGRLELGGEPLRVIGGVGLSSGGGAAFSLSDTSGLAYAGTLSTPSRLAWFDRTGNPSGSIDEVGDYTDFRLSPDETRLASAIVNPRTGNPDVSLTDITRGGPTAPFTFGPGVNASAVWSPDGSTILFRSTRAGGLTEFFVKSVGAG